MPKAKQLKLKDFFTTGNGRYKYFSPTKSNAKEIDRWRNQFTIDFAEKKKAAARAAAALQAQIPNDTEDGFGDFGNYDVWTPNNDSPTPTRNEQSPANSDDEGDLLLLICL
jgi:hydroxymethylpyrimidine pyrophosphatase-like HAD family hydrolase